MGKFTQGRDKWICMSLHAWIYLWFLIYKGRFGRLVIGPGEPVVSWDKGDWLQSPQPLPLLYILITALSICPRQAACSISQITNAAGGGCAGPSRWRSQGSIPLIKQAAGKCSQSCNCLRYETSSPVSQSEVESQQKLLTVAVFKPA